MELVPPRAGPSPGTLGGMKPDMTSSPSKKMRPAASSSGPQASRSTRDQRSGALTFVSLAAEAARSQFDPTTQWEQFLEALWLQLNAGFGLIDEDVNQLSEAAWFDGSSSASALASDADDE